MSERNDDLTQSRLDKLQKIRQRGIDPYPARCERSHQIQEAILAYEQGKENPDDIPAVKIAGRILGCAPWGKLPSWIYGM